MSATDSRTRRGEGHEALWNAVRSTLRSQRDGAPLERVPREAPLPASFTQQGGWVLEQLRPASYLQNLAVALRMTGHLDKGCLQRSFEEAIRRHEVLRTTLRFVGGELLQVIHPPARFALPITDLGELSAADREAEARRQAAAEARAPFDMEQAPLLRARLFRLDESDQVLVLTVHHLVFDGWSFDPFMRDLCAIYGALVDGRVCPLPEPVLQYADWAVWQRRRMDDDAAALLLLFWKEQLRGSAPVLPLPFDRPRQSARTFEIGRRPFTVTKERTISLKHLGAEAGATPFVTLLAAFQVLLYRYTQEENIVVGSPVANRNRIECEDMLGRFINTLPIRVWLGDQPTFRDLLVRVRDAVFGAFGHQELPFELLVQSLPWKREASNTPLLPVTFVFQNLPKSSWKFPGLTVNGEEVLNGTPHCDLTLFTKESADGFSGSFEYDAALFDAATIERMADHFLRLLEGIADDPGRNIDSIPLISKAEREWLVNNANGPAASRHPGSMVVHRVFEAQAQRTPEATAVLFGDTAITYRELDGQANQLARYLENAGVGPEDLVGLCLSPSLLRIVSMLAVLKRGAAYVPMDRAVPRLLDGMTPAVILIDAPLPNAPAAQGIRLIDLIAVAAEISRQSTAPMESKVSAESLAYVMFTSGSTGVPKGVSIPHRGIVRLVCGANYVDVRSQDVFMQLASFCFDAATFEIWGALLNGATLVVPAAPMSLGEIGEAIRRYRVSILFLTSRLFELMVDTHLAALSMAQQVLVGGDVLSVSRAERFARHASESRLINCYGPTENTTFTTFYRVAAGETFSGRTVPIGRPISNTQIYILDAREQLAPIGVIGEVYVGGDGLMRGYLHDEELTRNRTIPNPFDPSRVLYRTGDRARLRDDGAIEFHGRADNQVKIRGFRVEPGEAEAVLGRCPLVKNSAVVARRSPAGEMRLVAFVVPQTTFENSSETIAEIRRFLRAQLPGYLVPSEFVLLDSLPLNANGKVDMPALRSPAAPVEQSVASFIPRDHVDEVVMDQFKQALEIDRIAADVSFFDMGGDSLMALRLFAAVEEALGVSLPLASLFEHPTVGAFGSVVRNTVNRGRTSTFSAVPGPNVVEIKSGRSRAPLFLVPGGSGGRTDMALYAQMMVHLRGEHRVYGLRVDQIGGTSAHRESIEKRAEACTAEIRRIQPHGPYALGGECVGGVVAFEIAQQLAAAGEEVALLALFDAWLPLSADRTRSKVFGPMRSMAVSMMSVFRLGMANIQRELDRNTGGADLEQSMSWIDMAATFKRKGLSGVRNLKRIAGSVRGAAFTLDQVMRYRPKHYRGPVTLICSSEWERLGAPRQWERVAGDALVVHTLPGAHESYIRSSPEAAARLLERCLEEIPEVDR